MNELFNIRHALVNESTEFLRSRIQQAGEPSKYAKEMIELMAQDVEWLKAHPKLSDKVFDLLKMEEIPAASFNKHLTALVRAGILKHHPQHQLALFEKACEKGEREVAFLLVKKELIERTLVNKNGENAVHIAARYGESELVLALLTGASFLQSIQSRFRNDNPLAATDLMGHTPAEVAYLNGHSDLSIALIKRGAPVDNQDIYGNTLLHMAASRNDKALALILGQHGAYLNSKNHAGDTPLHLAAQNGLTDMMIFLKEQGANASDVNHAGKTPLLLAIEANVGLDTLQASHLLEDGINVEDNNGHAPLFEACLKANSPVALALLEQGAKLGSLVEGYDAAYLALRQGMEQVAKKLILQVPDINAYMGAYLYAAYLSGKPELVEDVMQAGAVFDKKCIAAAAFSGTIEVLDQMLRGYNGADREIILEDSMEAALYGGSIASFEKLRELGAHFPSGGLAFVANSGNVELLNHLIRSKVVQLPDDMGDAFFKAAEKGKGQMVKRLLELGADVNQASREGNYPLHLALKAKSEDTALILLAAGASLSSKDQYGHTPLHWATLSNLPMMIKLFIERGAAVNELNEENETPLFYAKNPAVALLLLENGASLDRFNKSGFNVLHEAVDGGNLTLVDFYHRRASALLDVPAINRAQYTPREVATLFNDAAILRLYGYQPTDEEKKRLINTVGDQGKTPIMNVCTHGDIELARTYLKQGADIHAVDDAGQTALFYSLQSEDLVQLLFEYGANLNHKNNAGDTALKMAYQMRSKGVIEKLVELGADVRLHWKDISFLQRIRLSSLNFSPEFIQKVETLDQGFTEEVLSAKFLAHSYSLSGKFSLQDQMITYTGNRNEDVFRRYRKHVNEGYKEIMEDWRVFDAVRNRLEPETKQVLATAKPVFDVLRLMPQVFEDAVVPSIEVVSVSPLKVKAKIQSGRPIMLYGGWDKHAVGSVIYGTQVARANRGEGSSPHPGILISNATNLENIIREFADFDKLNKSYFTEGIQSDLEAENTLHLLQSEQKVGNCTLATLRSLEYAALYHLLSEHFDEDAAVDIAHSIKRQRTLQSRMKALDDYLEAHSDQTKEKYPPNLDLLTLILNKKTHAIEHDRERNQKIYTWAAARGIKL